MDARFDIQGLSIRELLLKGWSFLNFQVHQVHCAILLLCELQEMKLQIKNHMNP